MITNTYLHDPPPFNGSFFMTPAFPAISKSCDPLLWIPGGGRCLQGNGWFSPLASMTSRLASVTFKMASKVFIEETDKNVEFITEIL